MKIEYIANDGKRFQSENDCEEYERMLCYIRESYKNISQIIDSVPDSAEEIYICTKNGEVLAPETVIQMHSLRTFTMLLNSFCNEHADAEHNIK